MKHDQAIFVFLLALALGLALLAGCEQRRPETDFRAPPPEPIAYCPPPALPEPSPPIWLPVVGKTVVLDAGHGGHDFGTNHFGLREKDIVLDLASRTAARLRAKGVIVRMTRQSDAFVTLPDRSAFANRNPNAVFVSIHVNASAANPNAAGIETFVLSSQFTDEARGQAAAEKFKMNGADAARSGAALAVLTTRCRTRGPELAKAMQDSLVARLGEANRGVKTANLAVLRETYFCPAVLVEVGFLTHRPTADRMRTDEWRNRASEALAEGIVAFLRQPE